MVNESNGIVYNGAAKITFLKGKKIIKTQIVKNNGSELLFKLLTLCVCGVNISKNMPLYLDLGYYVNNSTTYKSNIANRVNVTSEFVSNVAVGTSQIPCAAKFTAIVPPTIVLSGSRNEDATHLRLYNDYYLSDDLCKLAEISLPIGQSISFSESYTIVIEWYMYFTNKSITNSGGNGTTTTPPVVGDLEEQEGDDEVVELA